jgi:hypothetical protein
MKGRPLFTALLLLGFAGGCTRVPALTETAGASVAEEDPSTGAIPPCRPLSLECEERDDLSVPAVFPKYTMETRDLPDQAAFELILRSADARELCLETDRWPNEHGGVHYGSTFVRIVHDAGELPLPDQNLGFCYRGCGFHRIPAGGSLRGRLPYGQFGNVETVRAMRNRKLEYFLPPFPCEPESDGAAKGGGGN